MCNVLLFGSGVDGPLSEVTVGSVEGAVGGCVGGCVGGSVGGVVGTGVVVLGLGVVPGRAQKLPLHSSGQSQVNDVAEFCLQQHVMLHFI